MRYTINLRPSSGCCAGEHETAEECVREGRKILRKKKSKRGRNVRDTHATEPHRGRRGWGEGHWVRCVAYSLSRLPPPPGPWRTHGMFRRKDIPFFGFTVHRDTQLRNHRKILIAFSHLSPKGGMIFKKKKKFTILVVPEPQQTSPANGIHFILPPEERPLARRKTLPKKKKKIETTGHKTATHSIRKSRSLSFSHSCTYLNS